MLSRTKELLGTKKVEGFSLGADEVLRYKDRVCILQDQELKRLVLEEWHKSRLNIHPRMTNMYQDIKKIREDLTYDTQLAKIVDQRLKQLRGKDTSLVWVVWNEATRDSTWEFESKVQEKFL
ncbi:hypothetical protein CR513_28490, partial [Mucuna pruriens]